MKIARAESCRKDSGLQESTSGLGRARDVIILKLLSEIKEPSERLRSGVGSTASNCTDDKERLFPRGNLVGQLHIPRFERVIFATREEAQERAALLRSMIANGATQHRISKLKRIDDGANRRHPFDLNLNFGLRLREPLQVIWNNDADQARV